MCVTYQAKESHVTLRDLNSGWVYIQPIPTTPFDELAIQSNLLALSGR